MAAVPLALFFAGNVNAQSLPLPKYEFRGAWIATVRHLDWPDPATNSAEQIALLKQMLDGLQVAGINAVFFQIRSESDAMYESSIEPWSYWLTGEQGRGPEPYYDPLSLAIEEAHKRGMELHAWFNPYRADRGSPYPKAQSHVTHLHPGWILPFENLRILDPGKAAVRNHVVSVVMDVVRRYDIDGVHFDDYFYPYPTLTTRFSNEDSVTFSEEPRGFVDLGDWRRSNVDLLIAQLADSIRAEKTDIKFGISPFGIRRTGQPFGISGMDAVDQIWADPLAWVEARTVDYLVPQLYWPFGRAQDYAKLARWWADNIGEVHLYTGNALHRTDANTYSATLFGPEEIPNQLRLNRSISEILGAVFFRARNVSHFHSHGIVEVLREDLYRHVALTPPMKWKSSSPPPTPQNLQLQWISDEDLTLQWDPVPDTRRYVVYRVQSNGVPDATTASQYSSHILAVTGESSASDRPPAAHGPYHYFVQSVGHNSAESGPSTTVSVFGRALPEGVDLQRGIAAFPNPSRTETAISFIVDTAGPVTLQVTDMFGRPIRLLADRTVKSPGVYAYPWDGSDAGGRNARRGIYTVQLQRDDNIAAVPVGILR